MKDLIVRQLRGGGITRDAAETSVKMLAKAYLDYKQIVQEQETKRADIAAWRQVQLARIEKDRHILELYLTQTFKERATNIEGFFQRLDVAIEQGNDQLIAHTIGAILSIARESPLAQARELIEAMGSDDVKVIDI